MSGFKLLAIVPLKECSRDYRKSLKPGEVYQFYKNYDIQISNGENRIKYAKQLEGKVPNDFFDLDNGIKLNISAVVGENGSGKSSLFELFYYLVYQVFINLKVNGDQVLEPKSKEIEQRITSLIEDIRIEQIDASLNQGKHYDDSIELRISELINEYKLYGLRTSKKTGADLQRELLSQLKNVKNSLEEELNEEKRQESLLANELAVSVLYELDGTIFELKYSKATFYYIKYDKGNPRPMDLDTLDVNELSKLFYTISINYSAHSLNSLNVGNWISRLFHKNDAYITPVVINPMRTNGNFDINKEMHLSKERLLSNMIYDYFNEESVLILDKYQIDEIHFSVKKNYRFVHPIDYDQSYFSDNFVGKLLKAYLKEEANVELSSIHGRSLAYIDKKIEKIKENYGFLIFGKDSSTNTNDVLLKFLLRDDSHITKKLKQTLNFIKYTIKNPQHWKIDEAGNCTFTFIEMIDWIKDCVSHPERLTPYKLIEYCFPGYFDVNFNFSIVDKRKNKEIKNIKLEKMSSGELQMILNINSIQYHLYNLQSIHDENKDSIDNETRVKYRNINIVLDEIELYYHPNMQRQMVKNIRKSIERIKSEGEAGISSINITFLTHSPFILSDIPNENVLRLSPRKIESEIREEETFAANINDLLASGFFMETLMGDFAEDKISNVIQQISDKERENEDNSIIDLIGDSFLKVNIDQFKKTMNDQD